MGAGMLVGLGGGICITYWPQIFGGELLPSIAHNATPLGALWALCVPFVFWSAEVMCRHKRAIGNLSR